MIGTKKWGLKMFLVIYKKGNKLYFNTVKRLTEKFTVTNEKFETVKLGYNNKIRSFKFDGWEDFKRIREELRKYSLRMYVACVRYPNKREIKLVLELMKNPFYNIMIEECEAVNPDIEEGNSGIKVIELWDESDWEFAEKEFNFSSDFYKNLW